MKRLLAVLLVVVALAAPGIAPAATCEYDDSQSHPLRIAAYLVYPVGLLVQSLVAWPIHYVVSQPTLEPVFGHRPHHDAFEEDYF